MRKKKIHRRMRKARVRRMMRRGKTGKVTISISGPTRFCWPLPFEDIHWREITCGLLINSNIDSENTLTISQK